MVRSKKSYSRNILAENFRLNRKMWVYILSSRRTFQELERSLIAAFFSMQGEVIREANISEVTFHRWKKQFGQMEVNEAKRLKELERENTELKKMLAESLLKNRVLEFVCEKKL